MGERGDGFRADIEGLRGVAVLAVVVYHAGLAGLDQTIRATTKTQRQVENTRQEA